MIDHKRSIMVVDDEQMVTDLLYDNLIGQGYLCTTALNGNEALSKLDSQDFDAVLLDIRLPEISGMDLLSRIRSQHPCTVVAMVTAVNDLETAVEAMKLGAADYIVKPFSLDRVNSCLQSLLSEKEYSPEKVRSPAESGGGEKQARLHYLEEIDAIACGAEARVDSLDGHSKRATESTIEVAGQLDIPQKHIRKWAARRASQDAERSRRIKSSLTSSREGRLPMTMVKPG